VTDAGRRPAWEVEYRPLEERYDAGNGWMGLSGGCAVMGGMAELWLEAAEEDGGWAETGVCGLLVFWPYDD
jgi:hypothetical protein